MSTLNSRKRVPIDIGYINYDVDEVWTNLVARDVDGWPIGRDVYLTYHIKQKRFLYIRSLRLAYTRPGMYIDKIVEEILQGV